jgi:hypothetical protein
MKGCTILASTNDIGNKVDRDTSPLLSLFTEQKRKSNKVFIANINFIFN